MSRRDKPELDLDRISKVMAAAMRFKAAMQERGKDRAIGKCPFCTTGRWHGALMGPKQHLRVECDGCDVQMME